MLNVNEPLPESVLAVGALEALLVEPTFIRHYLVLRVEPFLTQRAHHFVRPNILLELNCIEYYSSRPHVLPETPHPYPNLSLISIIFMQFCQITGFHTHLRCCCPHLGIRHCII